MSTNSLSRETLKKIFGIVQGRIKDHTHANFVGSTNVSSGIAGFVPPPPIQGSVAKFLKEDGTWAIPPSMDLSAVTPSSIGAVSKSGDTMTGSLEGTMFAAYNANTDIGTYLGGGYIQGVTVGSRAANDMMINPSGGDVLIGRSESGTTVINNKLQITNGFNIYNAINHQPGSDYPFVMVFNSWEDGGNVGYKSESELTAGNALKLGGFTESVYENPNTIARRNEDGSITAKRIDCYSAKVSSLPQAYYNAGITIREADHLGVATGSANEAPRLGFHWSGRTGASIAYLADGTITAFAQDGSSAATIKAAAFTVASSRKIKTNIQDLSDEEAAKILDVDVVSFDYTDTVGGATDQRGVIAEDVYKVIPSAVMIPDGYDEESDDLNILPSVDYSKFVPYLIKMIQIQQREINQLKQKE